MCVLAEGERAGRRKWMGGGGGVEPKQISGCWKGRNTKTAFVRCFAAAVRRVEVDRGQKLRPAQIKTMSKVRV